MMLGVLDGALLSLGSRLDILSVGTLGSSIKVMKGRVDSCLRLLLIPASSGNGCGLDDPRHDNRRGYMEGAVQVATGRYSTSMQEGLVRNLTRRENPRKQEAPLAHGRWGLGLRRVRWWIDEVERRVMSASNQEQRESCNH